MPVFNQAPESKFAFVVVAGKRARQLMSGAIAAGGQSALAQAHARRHGRVERRAARIPDA